MTAEEYFGDWVKVIDKDELNKIMRWIQTLDDSDICPSKKNIFRAFRLCSLRDCRVIMLGQDPYPQKGVATGVLFGNSKETPEELLSPSLQVVKECAINYERPHGPIEFDNTLESWAKQGVLMINSALTCKVDSVGSHVGIWQPFTSKLIRNLSSYDNGFCFVLFGGQAGEFKKDILGYQKVIEVYHPAYYARRREIMPYETFTEVNKFLKGQYNKQIEFYKEC